MERITKAQWLKRFRYTILWPLEKQGWIDEERDFGREMARAYSARRKYGKNIVDDYFDHIAEMEELVNELNAIGPKSRILQETRDSYAEQTRKARGKSVYIAKYGREVKVGVSSQVDVRLQTHAKATGFKANLLATFPGDESVEFAICEAFSRHTSRDGSKEWFHAGPVAYQVRKHLPLPEGLNQMIWSQTFKMATDYQVIACAKYDSIYD